ncbi:MAG: trehalose-phosphatase [Pontixanthobacter sp.]
MTPALQSTPSLPLPPPIDEICGQGPVALFLDFDGTLVPIASGPDAIAVPADLGARLEQLAARLDGRLGVVSGRGLDDIDRHVGAMAVARAGSHGAHRVTADGTVLGDDPAPLGANIVGELQALAARYEALFENKAHGAAIHYRKKPEHGSAIEERAGVIAQTHGLTVKTGKCVVELVRPGAEKGGAVAAFMAQTPFADSRPIFVGDDVTDEDGFAAATRFGGFGIAVGERQARGARYALPDVKDVHAWLKL